MTKESRSTNAASDSAAFSGTIPDFYDECLGPVIFAPYAEDLTRRIVACVNEGRLLETACGTGQLTRRLDAALPRAVRIVATDLNEAMLVRARSRVAPSARLEWRTTDAAALPFPSGSFDALACQFGWMFVPDKAAAFREARRVLRSSGALFFSVWCRMEDNPFARSTHAVVASFFRSDPPAFYQVPFGFHDAAAIDAQLRAAGFRDVAVERVTMQASAPSVREFARGLVEGNPISIAIRDAGLPFPRIVDAVATALAAEGGDAPFRSTMNALVFSARAA